MPGTELSFIGVFVGALLGALVTQLLEIYVNQSRVNSKREVLMNILKQELSLINERPQEYKVEKALYSDPITLVALERILDGQLLDSRSEEDEKLMTKLLILSVQIRKYNDFVRIFNSAQSTTAIPDNSHRQMYDNLVIYHSNLIKARDDATPLLTGTR